MNVSLHPLGSTSAVAGIVIVACYWLVAVGVAPYFLTPRSMTRVGGVFFFMLCGMTHLELAGHYLAGNDLEVDGDLASWHMFAMMIPQAWSVGVFAAGLHADGRIGVDAPPVIDQILTYVARVRWLNRVSDFINRHLRLYASGYGLFVLSLIVFGV